MHALFSYNQKQTDMNVCAWESLLLNFFFDYYILFCVFDWRTDDFSDFRRSRRDERLLIFSKRERENVFVCRNRLKSRIFFNYLTSSLRFDIFCIHRFNSSLSLLSRSISTLLLQISSLNHFLTVELAKNLKKRTCERSEETSTNNSKKFKRKRAQN